MCGIGGFLSHAENESDASLAVRNLLASISHRGPDCTDTLIRPELGLYAGMCRLSIIDLANGRQPIWNEDLSVAVLFNGEIYNYRELRQELERRGHQFRTDCDTEVLVHLYEDHGTEMFSRLRGMFGICLVDFARHKLVLARDHFGQKPLYYTHTSRTFAFASELKALIHAPGVELEFRDDRMLEFAQWLKLAPPKTHFENVLKLPAAHFLEVDLDSGRASVPRPFWSYTQVAIDERWTMDAAVDELHRRFSESIDLHLRADVPTGLLLSGGLDSRCVAFYSQRALNLGLRTYSVGFGDTDSELDDARKTAQEIRSSAHIAIELGPEDFLAMIDDVAWHLDEPVGDPAAFAVMAICRRASEDVRVLLGGEGSDELFGGYADAYLGCSQTLTRSRMLRKRTMGLMPHQTKFPHGRLGRLFYRCGMSPAEELASIRHLGLPGDVREPRGLRADQLSQLMRLDREIAESMVETTGDDLRDLTAFDIRWHLAESLLQKSDKMSMAASVELRCPFLDVELASFAASLPSRLKLDSQGIGKKVLRECLQRNFSEPKPRPKKGFPVPTGRWLRNELRELVEETVFAPQAALSAVFDRGLLRSAWQDHLDERWDGGMTFYSLMLYELWRKSFSSAIRESRTSTPSTVHV